jgi:hypothetical protein
MERRENKFIRTHTKKLWVVNRDGSGPDTHGIGFG